MEEKLDDVWKTRDYPILKAAIEYVDRGVGPGNDELVNKTGLSVEEITRGIAALKRRGLVEVDDGVGGPGGITNVSGEAYLVTGLHPDGNDALETLASMFRQAAEKTSDPEEKSRLRRAASAMGDVAGQVGAGVMTAYLAYFGGIG